MNDKREFLYADLDEQVAFLEHHTTFHFLLSNLESKHHNNPPGHHIPRRVS